MKLNIQELIFGDPHDWEITWKCPDCGKERTTEGTDFSEERTTAADMVYYHHIEPEKYGGCPHWKWRLKRTWLNSWPKQRWIHHRWKKSHKK